MTGSRVCVIGAGSSGIAACQVLKARGIAYDCFEKGSQVGGNWRYDNDNGVSSAYASLFINTSRRRMQFKSYPMPADYPDYPHHTQIAAYFESFVDHFGLRPTIRFRTEISRVAPAEGGGWEVSLAGGERARYGAVLVASGHHWDPRWPEVPGRFAGRILHSHHYRTPDVLEGQRVLVVGFGNSACDIAVESSRVARATYLSVRRGAHVIPKYILGHPTDELAGPLVSRLPLVLQRWVYTLLMRLAQGSMEAYGLPRPDHRLLEAHPTISSELLLRIGHGRVAPRPALTRLDGERVCFADGSSEAVDVIVYCTGYNIRFPFLGADVLPVADNHVHLYRHVVDPERPGLYFIGLIQPLGAIMPLAEAQAEWVADLIGGRCRLPAPAEMKAAIARDERRLARRYVASPRHTIQVDFFPYLRQLEAERRR
jgi:dimethylaniline monooxygenase (N-oxide forming)